MRRIVLGTIMGRHNEVVACFNSDREESQTSGTGQRVRSSLQIGRVDAPACEYCQRGKSDVPLPRVGQVTPIFDSALRQVIESA